MIMRMWQTMYDRGGIQRRLVKGLSYIRSILLRRDDHPEHGELMLHLKRGKLMLGTQDTLYSWQDRYMNFVWALEKVDFSKWPMPRILLLGFGLGSVPYILEKKYKQSFVLEGVDIHPTAVAWASKYTISHLSNPTTVHVADGVWYVREALDAKKVFDMVIVDVCVEDRIPASMEERSFIEAVYAVIAPGGMLLYNRFYSTYGDQFRTERFIKKSIKPVFGKVECWDYKGTAILVGRK